MAEKSNNNTDKEQLKDHLSAEYFDTLNDRIMERIDSMEKMTEERPKSFKVIFKPILYMAASFLLVMGGVKMLQWTVKDHQSQEIASKDLSHQDEDEYYDYFMTVYDDAVLDDLMTEKFDSVSSQPLDDDQMSYNQ
ncbi:hypothetical protein [Falsiporphyromonas endometrii]|uniref:Uncharacterized protein n=1 Tax=Falsiporphyromonas endometrii TaxID=1387297 RepID=A0ABV9K799_9PORP